MNTFGIDKASFYTSPYFINLTTLARARGVDSEKFTKGLGQRQMAVIPPDESIVTMAANAAENVLQDEEKSNIRTLLIATESGIDQSKSAGIYVHRLLELSPHCRVVEMKQACYSGTCALQLALGYLHQFPDEKVLVITSDIARYGLNTPGESSQGGGAVAMLLSANPRLIAFTGHSGLYTEDVMDFWRPNYKDEALVEGKVSVDQYLKALKICWDDYTQQNTLEYASHQHFIYHIPFPRLAEKAHQKLRAHCKVERKSPAELAEALNPSLEYSRQIGNCYTGSLYLGLLSLLENVEQDLQSQRIGFYSYGSGCVAEFFSGTVVPGYQAVLQKQTHLQMLNAREALDIEQYERFYSYQYAKDGSEQTLPEHTHGAYRLSKIENHKQIYIKREKVKRHHEKSLSAKAPGKLILSGEHAVVSGNPAVAIAIDRYTVTTITQSATRKSVLFNLLNTKDKTELTFDKLRSLRERIKSGYQGFLNGEKGLRDILEKPFELVQYTAGNVLDKINSKMELGVEIQTGSELAIGCGMGSSAASIVSTNYALSQFFDQQDVGADKYFEWSMDAENIQHGKSSGIDVQMAIYGGAAYFKNGNRESIETPTHLPLLMINTGKSESTTGECVVHTQAVFNSQPELLKHFEAVTEKVKQALISSDQALLKEAIKQNHRLLVEIGVVPEKVAELITQIESIGGAAKISGAGSIKGNQAGVVLITGVSKAELQALSLPYSAQRIAIATQGVHLCEA